MNKEELKSLLVDLDAALLKAFPGPQKIDCLVVGGACLLFTGTTTRPTKDIDVIITDLFGAGEASLAVNLTETSWKVRKIIEKIGRSHGLRGPEKMFFNDDCAPFLVELGDIPPSKLLREYHKIVLRIPADLSYILACKLIAGRADKDFGDIASLRTALGVTTVEQAKAIVDRFFPDEDLQEFHDLSANLTRIFGPKH